MSKPSSAPSCRQPPLRRGGSLAGKASHKLRVEKPTSREGSPGTAPESSARPKAVRSRLPEVPWSQARKPAGGRASREQIPRLALRAARAAPALTGSRNSRNGRPAEQKRRIRKPIPAKNFTDQGRRAPSSQGIPGTETEAPNRARPKSREAKFQEARWSRGRGANSRERVSAN